MVSPKIIFVDFQDQFRNYVPDNQKKKGDIIADFKKKCGVIAQLRLLSCLMFLSRPLDVTNRECAEIFKRDIPVK
jgi:hypothetical protein